MCSCHSTSLHWLLSSDTVWVPIPMHRGEGGVTLRPIFWKERHQKKNECLGGLKEFLRLIIFLVGLICFSSKKILQDKLIIYAFGTAFQILTLALHRNVYIIFILDFNLVKLLVQDLLLQSLLKVKTVLEDIRRCSVQCVYIKIEKIKLFLNSFFPLSCFMQFSFVTFWFYKITQMT